MQIKLHPYFRWHLLFWVSYTLFKIYHEFVWIYPKYEELTFNDVLYSSTVAQVTMLPPKIIFTYWVIYKILPLNLSLLKKWVHFLIALLATTLLYRLFVIYITLPLAYLEFPEEQPFFSLGRISSSLIDILLVTGTGVALILLHRQQKTKKREQELEKEKIASELQFLKQQTNPHFLLNTLNNLYALARKKSDDTPEAIMKLSKLMRYVLYESACDEVSLNKELEIIKNYIDLERLRYGERLSVQLDLSAHDEVRIAPLLLLPLVENAFKHGASEMTENPKIGISLNIQDQNVIFKVINNTRKSETSTDEGIGLKNLRRQLELQYDNYELDTFEKDGIFNACLRIEPKQ